jgi:NAD(P)-dependent dehydrogenase (short-subunit alcohol dehydrogenase family)
MTSTTILLSGGNTGIGYASFPLFFSPKSINRHANHHRQEIAKRLLTTHQHITLYLGTRTLTKGHTAASTIQSLPSFQPTNTVHPIQLDLTSDTSISSCITTIQPRSPHIDVLINNAGIAPTAPDNTPAILRATFNAAYDTNVTGTALLTEACIPLLSASPNVPRVIFITSGLSSLSRVVALGKSVAPTNHAATSPSEPSAPSSASTGSNIVSYRPYVVSKTAMNMLAVSYNLQFREMGWKVNLVCPGLRKTKLNNFRESASDPALGAIEAVELAMDGSKVVEGAGGKEVGRAGGMWDWDGARVAW